MFSTIKAARLLGWTSLAVGATELIATRWLESALGVDCHGVLIKAFGVREVAAGLVILNQPGLNRTLVKSLWGRVAGDAADLGALALAEETSRNREGWATITAIVVGVTAMDAAVATLAHHGLRKSSRISKAAKQRARQSAALPAATRRLRNGATGIVAH